MWQKGHKVPGLCGKLGASEITVCYHSYKSRAGERFHIRTPACPRAPRCSAICAQASDRVHPPRGRKSLGKSRIEALGETAVIVPLHLRITRVLALLDDLLAR